MEILVLGLNHKRAPVELREKLAISDEALPGILKSVEAPECVVLSTCNRVEIYSAIETGAIDEGKLVQVLAQREGMETEELDPYLYRHRGAEAVRHLLRVAAGLDAMVVGETQILSQVKEAYRISQAAGRTGRLLNTLFQHAFYTAKRVHTETTLAEKNVSVPSVASGLAEKIFTNLSEKTALVLGAGETGELTLQALHDRGVRKVHVANRTLERAQQMVSRLTGEAHDLNKLPELLPKADILVSCASADSFLLGLDQVRNALKARRNEPMFLIDIAVPRSIDPEVNQLDNVYLFNIDDLESIVTQNFVGRKKQAEKCDPIIEEETKAYMSGHPSEEISDVIAGLRSRIEEMGRDELERTLGRLPGLPEAQQEEIRNLVHRIVNKVLHDPQTRLKDEAANGKGQEFVELVRRLFGIK